MVVMRIYDGLSAIDIYVSGVLIYYIPFGSATRTMSLYGDMRILHDSIL